MNRQSIPLILPLAILLLVLQVLPLTADSLPNILVIVSEDNGQELGCYGDPYVKTPVLDQLATEGVRFHNAYVPQAGCSQSRAAYLTGLYPHQNGQIGLATWKFSLYSNETPNLIRSLKAAGYRTGILGKLHVNPESAFPFDMKEKSGANFGRKKQGEYATLAEAFMAKEDTPFFLSVNYPDAHRPFIRTANNLPRKPLTGEDVKPLPYFGIDTPELREETADYYNCMSRLDTLIGDLLQALDRCGKADNTLIVYFGDHGADLLRGKRTSYEGGTRVPLIIKWPGHQKPGQVRYELVSTLDLMPTLLEVSKASPVNNLPGHSLRPLIEGLKPEWRTHLFTEFHLHSAHNFFPQRTVRGPRFKLIQNLMPNQTNPGHHFTLNRFFPSLPDKIASSPEPVRSAYVLMAKPPEFELYDLQEDPHEFINLAGSKEHQSIFNDLKQRLSTWRKKTKDPFLNPRNLEMLKAEVDACRKDGSYEKKLLHLNYTQYFFETAH